METTGQSLSCRSRVQDAKLAKAACELPVVGSSRYGKHDDRLFRETTLACTLSRGGSFDAPTHRDIYRTFGEGNNEIPTPLTMLFISLFPTRCLSPRRRAAYYGAARGGGGERPTYYSTK